MEERDSEAGVIGAFYAGLAAENSITLNRRGKGGIVC
jgi:hypothetical protein